MSVKSSKSSKLSKPVKLARYEIDILGVYLSENENPIALEEALSKIQTSFASKNESEKPQIKKCIMQIWNKNNGPYTIQIKASNGKQILESFSIKSIGIPQVGNLPIRNFKDQSLVFLPVLNKDYKSELFVFHPKNSSAQDIVIKLVKLMQIKDMIYTRSMSRNSPPKSENIEIDNGDFDLLDQGFKNGENQDPDNISEYSLSSNFFNNWYSKVENMVVTSPNSLYQTWEYRSRRNDLNDELYILNQYMKEIRVFMNNLYMIMHDVIKIKSIENGVIHKNVIFPPKTNFIEIIQKIKSSLNIVTVHENIIINPSAKEIINQLLLILRILSDANKSSFPKQPVFVMNVKDPSIHDLTVKYLTDNLNPANKEFWMTLGENYGYKEEINTMEFRNTVIDEFQIKRDLLSPNDEKIILKSLPKSFDQDSNHNSDIMDQVDFNRNSLSPDRRYEKNIHKTNNKIHENRFHRNYDSENDREYEKNYFQPIISHSQPNLHYSQPLRSVPYLEDEIIYSSNQPIYDLEKQNFGIPMHQRNDRRHHNNDLHNHHSTSTWKDRQCRFIDAVQLRNGRLVTIMKDRTAQNRREISVSCNEVMELLTEYGDVFSAKNALGEVGYCPSSIAIPFTSHF